MMQVTVCPFSHSPQAIGVHIQPQAEAASAQTSEALVHFTQIVNGGNHQIGLCHGFPWWSSVRFCASNEGATGSTLGQRTEIPQAAQCGQTNKQTNPNAELASASKQEVFRFRTVHSPGRGRIQP